MNEIKLVPEDVVARVAKAIYESHGFKKPWQDPDTVRRWHKSCKITARLVLETLRTPTPEMAAAGRDSEDVWGIGTSECRDIWTVMVDAAILSAREPSNE